MQKAATTPLTDHKKNHQPHFNRNQQYSITALTDGGGSIVERYAYTAYGQPTILDTSLSQLATSAVGNRYTYTGREWDEGLGLYHYRARMYDAVAGRFVSRDPIGFNGGGPSLYSYVLARPTRAVDPAGLAATDTWRHHWIPQKPAGLFQQKCGAEMLAVGELASGFQDEITTPFTPGWGPADDSIHTFIHHRMDYRKNFMDIANRARSCCELLGDLHLLIMSTLLAAEFYYSGQRLLNPGTVYPDLTGYFPFPPTENYYSPHSSTTGRLQSVTAKVCACRKNPQPSPVPVVVPVTVTTTQPNYPPWWVPFYNPIPYPTVSPGIGLVPNPDFPWPGFPDEIPPAPRFVPVPYLPKQLRPIFR